MDERPENGQETAYDHLSGATVASRMLTRVAVAERAEALLETLDVDGRAAHVLEALTAERIHGTEHDDPHLTRYDVPDALWASDNEDDIPLLDINMQADALDLPFNRYDKVKRGRAHRVGGTVHFYFDDYRFDPLWNDPSPVVNLGFVNAVEPNFSTNAQMPMAVAKWGIYRKRWLARYWQSHGVRIFVDMALDARFETIALLGVPAGWKAYATYTYASTLQSNIERHFEMASERAGTDSILYVVYGGEKKVQELCRQRGWIWLPVYMQTIYRRVTGNKALYKRLKAEGKA